MAGETGGGSEELGRERGQGQDVWPLGSHDHLPAWLGLLQWANRVGNKLELYKKVFSPSYLLKPILTGKHGEEGMKQLTPLVDSSSLPVSTRTAVLWHSPQCLCLEGRGKEPQSCRRIRDDWREQHAGRQN